jgi:hypothetical protein
MKSWMHCISADPEKRYTLLKRILQTVFFHLHLVTRQINNYKKCAAGNILPLTYNAKQKLMKKIFIPILILFFMAPCSLIWHKQLYAKQFGDQQTHAKLRSFQPAEAKMILETRADILLVDVRTPSELKEGKVAGSTLTPFFSILKNTHGLPKD